MQSSAEQISCQQFWSTLSVLIYNFHAVNRKIFACILEKVYKIDEVRNLNLESLRNNNSAQDFAAFKECMETDLKINLENPTQRDCGGFLIKQKLLTKKYDQNVNTLNLIDFSNNSYTCVFLDKFCEDFCLKYENGTITFKILNTEEAAEGERWFNYVLRPKLFNWARNDSPKPSIKSLQLINVEEYNDLYKSLKVKYSENLKKSWLEANESTDPLKFIYEDLAIAAYLICLWKSRLDKPPNCFADLGCGNGLLVYVLNEEGYSGYGYDIRCRKLWSLYPPTVQARLIEATIVPDKTSFFPDEVDFLIGNHSDELSPWLPIMTALKSYELSYFLLPCCAFEFSGAKFQRRNAKLSTYQDFFQYAAKISNRCGFQTLEDRLKIPSTKRLALIGHKRNYEASEHGARSKLLQEFVRAEILKYPHMSGEAGDIKLREKQEPVRNCTRIDKNILNTLVSKIFQLLLSCTPNENDDKVRCTWNAGRKLTLNEIAASLSQSEKKQLKAECGGLKTLLRNKHEVFEFSNDCICLRKPEKRDRPQNVKRRFCYFDEHHPNGCPLSSDDCSFLHVDKCKS